MPAMQGTDKRDNARSSMRWFTGFLSIVAVLAGIEIYALVSHNRERTAPTPPVATPARLL